MVKILISLILTLTANVTFSQKVTVSPDMNNIVLLGVDNPLTIVAEKYPCKGLVIKSDNGEITGSSCEYLFRPNKIGKADIIIYVRKSGRLIEIGRNSFRVKNFPNPTAKV